LNAAINRNRLLQPELQGQAEALCLKPDLTEKEKRQPQENLSNACAKKDVWRNRMQFS
jgi:hypothetical protein